MTKVVRRVLFNVIKKKKQTDGSSTIHVNYRSYSTEKKDSKSRVSLAVLAQMEKWRKIFHIF